MKEIICSLIKDDIRHAQFLNKIEEAGLQTTTYELYLSETIFKLAGIEQESVLDDLSEVYYDLIKTYNQKKGLDIDRIAEIICENILGFEGVEQKPED